MSETQRSEPEALALFNENIGLAHWYARLYQKVEEFDDLFQVASMGLWTACLTWNPSTAKLSWWAKIQMRHEVQGYLRKAGRLRGTGAGKIVPRHTSLHLLTERVSDSGENRFVPSISNHSSRWNEREVGQRQEELVEEVKP